MPRLFIYNTEAHEKAEPEKTILHNQFAIMIQRLWLGITWPSAILTVIFGAWMAWLYGSIPEWLWTKLAFVCGLYAYHFTLHKLYKEQKQGLFRYSSLKLRIWNEVATIFLVAIVTLASVKQSVSVAWGIAGLVLFIVILLSAIRIYKMMRERV